MGDKNLFMVLSNCVAGRDDEFNEWYDNVHLRDVLATPGIVSAQRYDVHVRAPMVEGEVPPEPSHRYLCVYEVDGDLDATMAKLAEAAMSGKMDMGDTLDRDGAAMMFWVARGPKVVKE